GIKQALVQFDGFLFVIAMAAMGLETKLAAIATTGIKPFYLAGLSWIFIATLSLVLVKTFTMGV
ncbi:MAG: putative sulfate exporter family transporter, partial [Cyanobacteria bacterium J06558_2]